MITAGYCYSIEYYNSENGEVSISKLWKRTKDNFWRVLGTLLGYALIVMIPIGLAVGIVALLTVAFGEPSGAIIFFMVILGMALFVLLYYFIVRWYFVVYIRIFEQRGFIESFKRSAQLVENNWWKTFGVIFVLGIIQSALSYIAIIPMYIIMIFGVMTGFDSNGDLNTGMMAGMGLLYWLLIIFSMYLAFLFLNGAVIQFHSLKEEKEGTSLFDQIDLIGTKKDSLFENEGEF